MDVVTPSLCCAVSAGVGGPDAPTPPTETMLEQPQLRSPCRTLTAAVNAQELKDAAEKLTGNEKLQVLVGPGSAGNQLQEAPDSTNTSPPVSKLILTASCTRSCSCFCRFCTCSAVNGVCWFPPKVVLEAEVADALHTTLHVVCLCLAAVGRLLPTPWALPRSCMASTYENTVSDVYQELYVRC